MSKKLVVNSWMNVGAGLPVADAATAPAPAAPAAYQAPAGYTKSPYADMSYKLAPAAGNTIVVSARRATQLDV